MRHHPRFERSCDVLLRVSEHGAQKNARLKDISNGGMFVEIAEPPDYGLVVFVTLETRSGPLEISAKVVHVLDPRTAETYGRTPGVGLEFEWLSAQQRSAIEAHVDALAAGLDGEAPARLVPDPDTPASIRIAMRVLEHCECDDLYAALDVDPTAPAHAVQTALDSTLKHLVPSDETVPALVARIGHARSLTKRIAVLMRDEEQRLHYDFRHGHIDPPRRLADASSRDVERLRRVWHRVYHSAQNDAVRLAKSALQAEAREDYALASKQGHAALEFDPFNVALRDAVEGWAQRAA